MTNCDLIFVVLSAILGVLSFLVIFKRPFWGVLALVILLPFHAFLVTSISHALLLSSFQYQILILWKEFILIGLFLVVINKIIKERKPGFKILWFDYLIVALFLISIVVSWINHIPLYTLIIGLRYDFLLFVTYFIFRALKLNQLEVSRILRVIIWCGVVLAIFAIIQRYFLPKDFLVRFGYLDSEEWSYAKGLPAYSTIGETSTFRPQSFFSGPNALATYLLIVWASLLALIFEVRKRSSLIWFGLMLVLVSFALFLTYSRSAWIALGVILLVYLLIIFRSFKIKAVIVSLAFLLLILVWLSFANLSSNITRMVSSTGGHITRNAASVYLVYKRPYGYGLGTVGPQSKISKSSPVEIKEEEYPIIASGLEKYLGLQTNPGAYGFILSGQIVPENWYLQIAVELGIIGVLIYIAIWWGIVQKIATKIYHHFRRENIIVPITLCLACGFLAHQFFLHTWSDAPTTITFAALLGISLGTNK